LLSGDMRMTDALVIWNALKAAVPETPSKQLDIDLSDVQSMDGGVMSLLVNLRSELAAKGVTANIVGRTKKLDELVKLYGGDAEPVKRHKPRKAEGFVTHIGRATAESLGELRSVIAFFGSFVAAAAGVVRHPRTGNLRDILPLVQKAGADAVPIVILINFLVGFVMGFQSARQLQSYGANIFVADIVGLAVTRELGPLMTAIIVCGRSGAAIAAELGTMKVSEEVDALSSLGLGPMRYLVFPRVLALLIVVPALTLAGDFVGVLGGLVVGYTSLDIGVTAYLNETRNAVKLWDIGSGLIKAFTYAGAVAMIACQQGFATSGGAEGVGRRTTSTVVTSLFAIVMIDALLTVVFRIMGV
jgi:phospholipid/cholesterol/gamma-HCH transport system permease protein